ncbi:MAG: hypothetical protein V1799_11135 [bacterium]
MKDCSTKSLVERVLFQLRLLTLLVLKRSVSFLFIMLSAMFVVFPTSAQFIDEFTSDRLNYDPSGVNGWTYYTGDGAAGMILFHSGKGYATITVDARSDIRNVWWALIRRQVSGGMDLQRLKNPRYALRIEARVKTSHAPRRINLHLNTQSTKDYHSHLMEFDLPDTVQWHTVSMTTKGFDALPGDTIYSQLALMDWGLESYRLDIDYVRVDIVDTDSAGADKGVQVPYHPPVPEPASFTQHIPVAHDGMIDSHFPDLNFNNWCARDETGAEPLLTVGGTQAVILRWDLSSVAGMSATGQGVLELTTYSLQRLLPEQKNFGMIRIVEILSGDSAWNQSKVTYFSFCQRQSISRVFNSQMIIDLDVSESRGGKNFAVIPKPVLQRLIAGTTKGIALLPLGAINASFYALENGVRERSPILHLTTE